MGDACSKSLPTRSIPCRGRQPAERSSRQVAAAKPLNLNASTAPQNRHRHRLQFTIHSILHEPPPRHGRHHHLRRHRQKKYSQHAGSLVMRRTHSASRGPEHPHRGRADRLLSEDRAQASSTEGRTKCPDSSGSPRQRILGSWSSQRWGLVCIQALGEFFGEQPGRPGRDISPRPRRAPRPRLRRHRRVASTALAS